MKNEKEKKQEENKVLKEFQWRVPQCCVEGWASCKHVPKKQRPVKNNVGL